jgi:hypothetical protein
MPSKRIHARINSTAFTSADFLSLRSRHPGSLQSANAFELTHTEYDASIIRSPWRPVMNE